MLLNWLQRPHVKRWWDDGDDTLEKVAAHYSADPHETRRFIAVIDGDDAGYFQYCRLAGDEVGIDQFLARADQLDRGIGSACIQAFVTLIAAGETAKAVSVDPHPNNARAIRAYRKCGFSHVAARSTPICHLMLRPL